MSRRSGRPSIDRGQPEENPSKPASQNRDKPRDETESSYSSNSNDSDYQVPEKRPKPAPRRPYVNTKKSKGRRLRRNLVKERKEQEESSTIPIETVTASSTETSSSQRAEKVDSNNPPLEQHKPVEAELEIDSDILAQYLEIMDQNFLNEDLNLVQNEQSLFPEIDEIVSQSFKKSEKTKLKNAKKDKNQNPGKNMATFNRIKDELIRGVDDFHWSNEVPTTSHSVSAESATKPAQKCDSDSGRESIKIVDEFFKANETKENVEKPSSLSTPNAGKTESASQELFNMKNSPAQYREKITNNKNNLIDLGTLPSFDKIFGGDLKTIETTNHRGRTYQDQPVGNIRNSYSQNQNPSAVRGSMNDLMNAPVIVYSGAENLEKEIRDLKERFSHLEICNRNYYKKFLELEAAVKILQTSFSQVVAPGGNLRMQNIGNESLQTTAVSGPGEDPIFQFAHRPWLLNVSVTAADNSDAEESDNFPHQDMDERLFSQNMLSITNLEPDQQISASLKNMDFASIAVPKLHAIGSFRHKPPPKYEERPRTAVSAAGNMKIEVVKSELESPNAIIEPRNEVADLKKQYNNALSELHNIRSKMRNYSIANNDSKESMGTVMPDFQQSDLHEMTSSPGRLVIIDDDFYSQQDDYHMQAESSGINKNHAPNEVKLTAIQQPGPSGMNQIRKATENWVIYDAHDAPSTSGSNQIQKMPNTITFQEPRVGSPDRINYWGDVSYYEDAKQVGRNFSCKGVHVRVDCFKNREFNKRNNGYHIGPFRNSDRSRETTGIRNKIDCGIMLYFIKGQLSIVNHSKCTVYVLSNISIGKREKISKEKRQTVIPPDYTVQVLRVPFDKKTNSIVDLKRTIDQFDESFFRVYISFEKSWTERGPDELPCWLALQLKPSGEE